MLTFIAYLIVRFGNPDDVFEDLFLRMLTFQAFRAKFQRDSRWDISRGLGRHEQIERAQTFNASGQFLRELLDQNQALGNVTPSFMSISINDFDFIEKEIVARETYITEEEKEVINTMVLY